MNQDINSRPSVVVAGLGRLRRYNAAKALDDVADVTLVDPRDAFVHNVAHGVRWSSPSGSSGSSSPTTDPARQRPLHP